MIKYCMHFSLILILFSAQPLTASSYDDAALEIIAKILPRLVLMSSQKNTIEKQMEICVLHNQSDESDAMTLIQKVRNNYPNGIKNYPLTFNRHEFSDAAKCHKSQIAFMFDADEQTVIRALKVINRNRIFTMAYNPVYLGNGVQASLFFGRKVIPYINFDAMQQSGIVLDNNLVQVSKIYSYGDGK